MAGDGVHPIRREHLQATVSANPASLSPRVTAMAERLAGRPRPLSSGLGNWVGVGLGVNRITIMRHGHDEEAGLDLGLHEIDYHLAQASYRLASRFRIEGHCWAYPVSGLGNGLGLNLLLVTSDNTMVFARRSPLVVGAGSWNVSAGEGMRPADIGVGRKVDFHGALARGAEEELGVEVDPAQVEVLSFGAYVPHAGWAILGWAPTDLSSRQLLARFRAGTHDGFEVAELAFCPLDPDAFVEFLLSHRPLVDWSLCLAHQLLIRTFGRKPVEQAVEAAWDRLLPTAADTETWLQPPGPR